MFERYAHMFENEDRGLKAWEEKCNSENQSEKIKCEV